MTEKEFFIQNVKVILSPQEKQGKNTHITDYLEKFNISYEKLYKPKHLKQGDYSFIILGKDYRDEFLIERKYGLNELLPCIIASNKSTKAKAELTEEELRNNLEYEFERMKQIGVKEKWLFIENCPPLEEMKEWTSGYETQKKTNGEICYTTLISWSCANRYDFKIKCLKEKEQFVIAMLNQMYYYFRNDMKLTYGKNWLTQAKRIAKESKNEI